MKNYYNYYLVALNISEPKYPGLENLIPTPRIINLNNDMLKVEDEKELTNLAYIDNLTSKYEEGVLRRYLFDKGIIDNLYTPLSIVRLSKSRVKDKFDNNKIVDNIKYYSPIFKSKDSNLITNLAITTLRKRNLSVADSSYLLQKFNELYFNNLEIRKISHYIIDEHDLKHLLRYDEYIKDKKSNPIKYDLLRQVVSILYEYEKNKTFDKFVEDVYGRHDFTRKILDILPEKIKIKKEDYGIVSRLNKEDLEKIKLENWDNEEAKEQFKSGRISEKTLLTLTLEDKLRAGVINWDEYIRNKEEKEIKFRK